VIAHWDDVEGFSRTIGHLGGTWLDLGRAAGSVGIGVKRIQVPAGLWSTPAHIHGVQEEIFWVLSGSGHSWQDGETYEVGAGDCLVHRADDRAHTLHAGPEGIDVLAFGQRGWDEVPTLTRTGTVWLGTGWAVLGGEDEHPWKREAAAGAPELAETPGARPPSIVNVAGLDDDRERRDGFAANWLNLGRAAGSVRTGLKHVTVEPGNRNCPLHCHSAEEELFVVLEGEGTLELVPSPAQRDDGAEEEQHPVRRGHVVSRPPGTGLAHGFHAADGGLTLLAYGTREPNDIAYYPRSNKMYWCGIGVIGRVEHLDYWDGEAPPL
jgi:uncharacterized cupin superfamily protein